MFVLRLALAGTIIGAIAALWGTPPPPAASATPPQGRRLDQSIGLPDLSTDVVAVASQQAMRHGDTPAKRRQLTEHLAKLALIDELVRRVVAMRLQDGRSLGGAMGDPAVAAIVRQTMHVDETRYFTDGGVEVTGRVPRRRLEAALAPLRLHDGAH